MSVFVSIVPRLFFVAPSLVKTDLLCLIYGYDDSALFLDPKGSSGTHTHLVVSQTTLAIAPKVQGKLFDNHPPHVPKSKRYKPRRCANH